MRLILNAALAFGLVAIATGMAHPFENPRLNQMRAEFAPYHWSSLFGPTLRGGFIR